MLQPSFWDNRETADKLVGELKYIKNPVLTYCMSNAVEDKDRKENLKLWKEKKSSERIDAAVTCIISHVRMIDQLNSNINNHVLSDGWSL